MVSSKIIQVVGYQNSGKTTFVTQLLQALTAKDLHVVTIKHHGHGEPDIPSNKDGSKHITAGAAATIVEGDGMLLLQAKRTQWCLENQIELLSHLMKPDVIIIEGHKQANYAKVLLLRDEKDHGLIEQLTNVRYILHTEENKQAVIRELVTSFCKK